VKTTEGQTCVTFLRTDKQQAVTNILRYNPSTAKA